MYGDSGIFIAILAYANIRPRKATNGFYQLVSVTSAT